MGTPVTALSRGFARIARQLNYTREFVSPETVKITIPGGLHYEAFDQAGGKPTLKSLFFFVESARSAAFWPTKRSTQHFESFADFHKILMENYFFIATARMDISQSLYNIEAPKHPLTITKTLDYIGNSSKCLTSVMECPAADAPYMKCSVQTVLVDPKTRKPIPFPDWWRDLYGKFVKSGVPLIMQPHDKPQTVNNFHVEVNYGDMDAYRHTNWISYIRFCHDACMNGVMKQKYTNITEDLVENGIKSFEISFKMESNVGDDLQVLSWEESEEEGEKGVLFEIKKGQDVCCYAKMNFHLNKLIQADE